MCIKVKDVLDRVVSKAYYQRELGGVLGRHTGQGWYKTTALCPFHNDRRPGTFYVNVHTGKYKCFSCGASGDVIDFHKHKYGLDTKAALKDMWRAA